MKKILKLGWILVLEGIITRPQLEEALKAQQAHPHLSIGEIIQKLFNIPETKIETIFVNQILILSLSSWIEEELIKKIKLPGIDVKNNISAIEIKIKQYKRNLISIKSFALNNDHVYIPTAKKNIFVNNKLHY